MTAASPSPLAELRQQARLATPLALSHLGSQLMGVVDTAMLGRFSDTALAGAGIATGLLFAVTVLGMGLLLGMDSLVPQALGAGQPGRARHLLHQGLRLGLRLSLPLTAVVAVAPFLLPLAGVPPEIAREAHVYTLARAPSILPFLLLTALRSYLQASSITWPIITATVAGNVVNAIANYVLIFGDPGLTSIGLPGVGLPALGSMGAALSTTVVTILSMSICALAVRRLHATTPVPPYEPDGKAMRSIVRLGLPVGLHLSAEVGIFALTAVLAGSLGTVAAAAHQVAITVSSFSFGAAVGIGSATAVRVGLAVGARDRARARMAGITGVAVGVGVMACPALVYLLWPAHIARLFTDDPTVVQATMPLLHVAALFQLSDGAQAVAAGALRGAGDTRIILWANLLGHYVIALGVALVLAFGLDMGAPGLWWGLSAGLTCVGILLIGRFLQHTRKQLIPTI